MITEAEARAALDGVIHLSFGMSLVALQMVRGIRVNDSGIEVDLVMNCPGCPAAEAALAMARQRLQALAGDVSIRFRLLPQVWVPPGNRNPDNSDIHHVNSVTNRSTVLSSSRPQFG